MTLNGSVRRKRPRRSARRPKWVLGAVVAATVGALALPSVAVSQDGPPPLPTTPPPGAAPPPGVILGAAPPAGSTPPGEPSQPTAPPVVLPPASPGVSPPGSSPPAPARAVVLLGRRVVLRGRTLRVSLACQRSGRVTISRRSRRIGKARFHCVDHAALAKVRLSRRNARRLAGSPGAEVRVTARSRPRDVEAPHVGPACTGERAHRIGLGSLRWKVRQQVVAATRVPLRGPTDNKVRLRRLHVATFLGRTQRSTAGSNSLTGGAGFLPAGRRGPLPGASPPALLLHPGRLGSGCRRELELLRRLRRSSLGSAELRLSGGRGSRPTSPATGAERSISGEISSAKALRRATSP